MREGEAAPQGGSSCPPPEIAPVGTRRDVEARSARESGIHGRSILLLHNDSFVGSYIRAVLAGADAMVLGPASISEGRELLSAGTGIDAAVLDFEMSNADSHALADELARQGLPYLFVCGRSSCNARTVMRGRPVFSWPFAGFEVSETLAYILDPVPLVGPPSQEQNS